MKKLNSEINKILKDTIFTTIQLLKIMIPISIIVKILGEFGLIEILGDFLAPVMNTIGLPGDFGLVWATAMVTNIYGGMVVFFNFSIENSYTVAQVTILGTMILLAHSLPVEVRITQKAGVKAWYMIILRVLGAFLLGWILSVVFTIFNLHQNKSILLWKPGYSNPSLFYWIIGEIRNYIMIFLIIFTLMILMRILKKSGVIDHLNNAIKPLLRFLGMSKDVAPITIIGMTLGLAYGGGLIIKESKSGIISKKDLFLSLSFMGMSHSMIEDTLLMVAIGASLTGVIVGRIVFTIIVIYVLIKIIKRLSTSVFNKYFIC